MAFYRVGSKPDALRTDSSSRVEAIAKPTNGDAPETQRQPASTPEHIRAVLARQDVDWVGNDRSASAEHAKAIKTYSEIHGQPVRASVGAMISGIDLYI
ncbi:MAG: hypothetical protein CTY22_10660 [Methylomonas sp.]|nr:MAG: hypothetical protein CTY23_12120 [Methylomonas sp.]PPD24782.1 MAG: hypothetical protein CTY22_10660 [Methylomonas sp.]PPD33481.1 MAG: hypothetical protein CTY21_10640 [Methylomonas sp.]PPD54885.1 MAG: hypothetical protein CTY11_02710 [Methylomonas sp.]